MTDFHGNGFFFEKNIQNGRLKKTSFSIPPILNIFFQKFHGLVLGLVRLMWLNLDGHEALRHKLKNGLKTQKIVLIQGPIHEIFEKKY